MARVHSGSKCEILNSSRCFTGSARKRTLIVAVRMSQTCQQPRSFDHLVRSSGKRQRNENVQQLRGSEIDDEVYFGGLLNRQVSGIVTSQDTRCIDTSQPVGVCKATAVTE